MVGYRCCRTVAWLTDVLRERVEPGLDATFASVLGRPSAAKPHGLKQLLGAVGGRMVAGFAKTIYRTCSKAAGNPAALSVLLKYRAK
jgi:hypothetical protein